MNPHLYTDTAKKIFEWLAGYQQEDFGYNFGGIYDPLDKRVMGEHYSSSFFALLGTLIIKESCQSDILPRIKNAVAFHITTSTDEYKEGNWAYHWDFNNYALISCYMKLQGNLTEAEKRNWLASISSWKENKHKAVNWILMRAYNTYARYKITGKLWDFVRYKLHLNYALKSQLSDGCIDDERNSSRPIQYHAYSAAMLHKIYTMDKNPKTLKAFSNALDYLISFIDPAGDFNYFGRGQKQIFGYGVTLYVLEAGKALHPERYQELNTLIKRCWAFLIAYRLNDGSFPLVLNPNHGQREYGWYDYHHLTVYNAFLAVWLAEAGSLAGLKNTKEFKKNEISSKENEKVTFYKPSGIVLYRSAKYFICFSEGQNSKYLSDCGLCIQHLYINNYGPLISCPGGPGGPNNKLFAEKHSKYDEVVRNFFAPIFLINESWLFPSGQKGTIYKEGKRKFLITYSYSESIVIERVIHLYSDFINIEDKILFKKSVYGIEELRIVNIPLIIDDSKVTFDEKGISIKNKTNISIFIETNSTCIRKQERLRVANGDVFNFYYLMKNSNIEQNTIHTANIQIRLY